ncbi:hypothetical protein [Rhizobium rhizogenes]|uniref:hypothetical protein n=1 Tax=Rhizobium rhizogenes TaxID=359 RepID=UPI0015743CCC|nr:hypothetical protein [Rhizobium rhizogenes]NTF66221.1 hypothetical protein [Rhizobium rhizogenes]NTG97274.1 hypothetical protein [Rhizobium rhizogenes]
MKPPWKFFAQLMSRRRPSETPDQTIEHDSDPKPVEIELQPAPTPWLASPEATPSLEHDDESPSIDAVEATTVNISEVDTAPPASLMAEAREQKAGADDGREQPVADVPAPAPASGVGAPSGMPQGKPSTVARKGRAGRIAHSPVAAGGEPVPQSPSASANPFFDEAASLDEDIKQLRNQLAQKLRLQNAQLRNMLKRFERP